MQTLAIKLCFRYCLHTFLKGGALGGVRSPPQKRARTWEMAQAILLCHTFPSDVQMTVIMLMLQMVHTCLLVSSF